MIVETYEDGWATGSISYYNKELERYKVDYKEDSNYIGPDEIDVKYSSVNILKQIALLCF